MRELVSALIDASPVPFVPVGDLEMPAYYDSKQQTIFIKTGLSEEQLFVSMAKKFLQRSLTSNTMKAVTLPISNPSVSPIWSVSAMA